MREGKSAIFAAERTHDTVNCVSNSDKRVNAATIASFKGFEATHAPFLAADATVVLSTLKSILLFKKAGGSAKIELRKASASSTFMCSTDSDLVQELPATITSFVRLSIATIPHPFREASTKTVDGMHGKSFFTLSGLLTAARQVLNSL
ncbi:hypothetical protein DIPPA_61418 [Diplonema papillatum]|nr:hypothetical protein DIPPA_61418 [Diplonema papillatum]